MSKMTILGVEPETVRRQSLVFAVVLLATVAPAIPDAAKGDLIDDGGSFGGEIYCQAGLANVITPVSQSYDSGPIPIIAGLLSDSHEVAVSDGNAQADATASQSSYISGNWFNATGSVASTTSGDNLSGYGYARTYITGGLNFSVSQPTQIVLSGQISMETTSGSIMGDGTGVSWRLMNSNTNEQVIGDIIDGDGENPPNVVDTFNLSGILLPVGDFYLTYTAGTQPWGIAGQLSYTLSFAIVPKPPPLPSSASVPSPCSPTLGDGEHGWHREPIQRNPKQPSHPSWAALLLGHTRQRFRPGYENGHRPTSSLTSPTLGLSHANPCAVFGLAVCTTAPPRAVSRGAERTESGEPKAESGTLAILSSCLKLVGLALLDPPCRVVSAGLTKELSGTRTTWQKAESRKRKTRALRSVPFPLSILPLSPLLH